MTPSCSICRHPDRESIEALLGDEPARLVAEVFGFHLRTVSRHDRFHRDAAAENLTTEADSAPLPALDGFDPTRVRLTGLRPAEWTEEAACVGQVDRDLDPWHPDDDLDRGDQRAAVDLAREVCGGCPVRLQCLALGLALLPLGDVHGMYAGLTPDELRAVARRRELPQRTVAQHGTRARRVAGCTCDPCKRAHAAYVAGLRAEERYARSDREPEEPVGPVATSSWDELHSPEVSTLLDTA